jgi:PST family polysaccharide transporter
LLSPEEFGLAALVLIFSAVTTITTDLALSSALVQRRSISDIDRSTVFWTNTLTGAVLTLTLVGVSGYIAQFYDQPAVQPLLIAFSFTFLLAGLSNTQAALLQRAMDFRALEIRTIASTLISGIVGVAFALAGSGAWALIAQSLVYSGSSVLLLWRTSSWRPSFAYSLDSLRDLGSYGLKVFTTQLVWLGTRITPTLLIGRYLGTRSAGYYAIGFNFMIFPLVRLVGPIASVAFPAFARMQDDRLLLARAWLKSTRLVAAIVTPAMIGMIAVAPDFVPAVFGEKWQDAAPVIQCLAWVGLLQALQRMGVTTLLAADRAGILLVFTTVALCVNLCAFLVGVRWGIVGVAGAFAIAATLLMPGFAAIVARSVGSSVRAFYSSIYTAMWTSTVMFICVSACRSALLSMEVPSGLRLTAAIGVGTFVYIPLYAWRAPDTVSDLRRFWRTKRAQSTSQAQMTNSDATTVDQP